MPASDGTLVLQDAPLRVLGRARLFGLLPLAKEIGQTMPDISPDTVPTGGEAVAIMRELFGPMLPNHQTSK